jgi:hypothetical protein
MEHHVQGRRKILHSCSRHGAHLDNASVIDHNIDVLKALCGCVWLARNVYTKVQVLYQSLACFVWALATWQEHVLFRGARPAFALKVRGRFSP